MNIYQRIVLIFGALILIFAIDYSAAGSRTIGIIAVIALLFFAFKGINKKTSFEVSGLETSPVNKNIGERLKPFFTRKTILTTIIIIFIVSLFLVIKNYQKNEAARLANLQHEVELNKIQEENKKQENEFKLIDEKRRQEQAEQQNKLDALAEAKAWNTLEIKALDNLQLKLRTSWSNGFMRYIFTVSPYIERIATARDRGYPYYTGYSFNILMVDKAGFELLKINIPLKSMRPLTNENGKLIALEINSAIACSMENYLNFTKWNITRDF